MRIELSTCWDATLPDRASQLAARPLAPGGKYSGADSAKRLIDPGEIDSFRNGQAMNSGTEMVVSSDEGRRCICCRLRFRSVRLERRSFALRRRTEVILWHGNLIVFCYALCFFLSQNHSTSTRSFSQTCSSAYL